MSSKPTFVKIAAPSFRLFVGVVRWTAGGFTSKLVFSYSEFERERFTNELMSTLAGEAYAVAFAQHQQETVHTILSMGARRLVPTVFFN